MFFKLDCLYRFYQQMVVTVFSGLILFSNNIAVANTTDSWQQGQTFYQHGHFAQAIENWQIALSEMTSGSPKYFDTLIHLAAAYQNLGKYQVAYGILQKALSIAQSHDMLAQKVLVQSYLGDILLAMQQPEAALKKLEDHLELARTLDEPLILANLLNNIGNVLSIQQYYGEALETYQEVAKIAENVDNTTLQIQALSNQVRVHFKLNQPEKSIERLEKALSLAYQMPDNYDKAFQLLGLGQLALRIQKHTQVLSSNANFPFKTKNYKILTTVLQLAEQYQNKRLISYAKGFLGQIYEHEQRYPEALQLTREAIFFAQEMSDILYLWKWQQARILQVQQNFKEALVAYQQALTHLQPIRTKLTTGQRNVEEVFYERIRPVYYGFADVLLQQAATVPSTTQKNQLLIQARDAIEQLKAAELQNYFQDDCVSAVQTQITQVDHLTKHQSTAVLYPILLSKRTELLLSLPDGIHQITASVGYDTIKQTVLEFRKNLQRTTDGSFIIEAKQLHQWLIAPIKTKLAAHNIKTLVIIPDGPLRVIPLSTLYDAHEKKFLFQRFALATTPGLTLMDPRRLPRENVTVLLNGLSEGVQGFSPLPNVPDEIKNIDQLFTQKTVLLNQEFSLDTINRTLQSTPYEIVHISSHGQFDRNPKKSFLLTYDNKLTMDRLEKLFKLSDLRKEKVELLTLSACQTAVGDERAALGLAGVAIKAGARSALASLWFVDDEATSKLVAEFYRQLQNPTLNKAQALQNAQIELIKQRKFRHPAFWAPFLLIGNWL